MKPLSTELILIRVTGEDRPGLTASVTEILAKYDATILGYWPGRYSQYSFVGHFVQDGRTTLGVHYEGTAFQGFLPGSDCPFYPITTKEYEDWVNMQGKNRYILTLLGRKLSARQISAVTLFLQSKA